MNMLKKAAALAATLVVAAGLSGCIVAPVVPPQGLLFTSFDAPIDTDMEQTTVGSKNGESSSMAILGLVAVGDASVTTAAANGNISRINQVDYSYLNILWIYQGFTVKVNGE